uniref:Predicted protein n=1 Tax=Hordeum vulgare subsp. vulgare TaxID=112509 RepID=F2EIP5_HORVV|nr:predicted protein [Hordeum vulgare subsp. vulgare]
MAPASEGERSQGAPVDDEATTQAGEGERSHRAVADGEAMTHAATA